MALARYIVVIDVDPEWHSPMQEAILANREDGEASVKAYLEAWMTRTSPVDVVQVTKMPDPAPSLDYL